MGETLLLLLEWLGTSSTLDLLGILIDGASNLGRFDLGILVEVGSAFLTEGGLGV